jgi:hypothetical protein
VGGTDAAQPPCGPDLGDAVVVAGPLDPDGAARLVERVRAALLAGGGPEIRCDLRAAGRPDLATVDALARAQLAAHRLGGRIRVVAAGGEGGEVCRLLGLAGLAGAVPCTTDLPVGIRGQAEAGEQPGVEEVVDVRDPAG